MKFRLSEALQTVLRRDPTLTSSY